MLEQFKKWLREFLGIAAATAIAWDHHEALIERLDRIESQLNAVQKDKLKFYVDRPKPKAAPMDFEASQRATLEEFKEN